VGGRWRKRPREHAGTESAIDAINRSQDDPDVLNAQEKLFPVLDDMLEEWQASYRPGYALVRIVGDRWFPYEFLDIETSEEARELCDSVDSSDLPLVILPKGKKLLNIDNKKDRFWKFWLWHGGHPAHVRRWQARAGQQRGP